MARCWAWNSPACPAAKGTKIKAAPLFALALLAAAGLACGGGGTDVQATVNAVNTAVEMTLGAMTQPADRTPLAPTSTPQPTLGIPPTATPGYTPQPGTAVPTNAPTNPPADTPAPADTPVPTQPAAQPIRPNGPLMHASHVGNAVTIDAQGVDWHSPQFYNIDQIVFQVGNWSGPADNSGTFAFGWDANNLYLFVNIVDDIHVQISHGETLYRGDSLELQFDADLAGDFDTAELNGDDYQLGLSPGENRVSPEGFLWNPNSRYGPAVGLSLSSRATEPNGGYIYEAALPWSYFGVTPSPGLHFGFALNSSDDDIPGTASQQSMLSSVSTRQLLNATSWGTLALDP